MPHPPIPVLRVPATGRPPREALRADAIAHGSAAPPLMPMAGTATERWMALALDPAAEVLGALETRWLADPAVEWVESPLGSLVVYGTVLPWHSDPGPDAGSPRKAWSEQDRVLPIQIAEWCRLRERFPKAALIVAGDFNMNLGGKHYYGTARGRKTLRDGLAGLDLHCATESERIPAGGLLYPPIDHVAVPSAWGGRTRVTSAWEGTTAAGIRLSDHSGLVVTIEGPWTADRSATM